MEVFNGHRSSSIPYRFVSWGTGKGKGINEGVLDTGRYIPVTGSKLFAALKGVVDAGIECPHGEDKLPNEERITGGHLNKDIKPAIIDIKNKIIGGK